MSVFFSDTSDLSKILCFYKTCAPLLSGSFSLFNFTLPAAFMPVHKAMKMREYCLGERPREKLKERGARALGTGELIAVLLRTGIEGRNVLDVAQALLAKAEGKLCTLSEMSVESMCSVPGIGPDKAVTLCAAFELARRWAMERSGVEKVPIRTAEAAYRAAAPRLRRMDHEEFWVMYMNRSNYVLGFEQLTSGDLSNTSVDIPRLVRRCLEKNATAVILFHNHPSDNPMPGSSDINATAAVRRALETMDKSLLDHIIVADGSYYSFAMEQVFTMCDGDGL